MDFLEAKSTNIVDVSESFPNEIDTEIIRTTLLDTIDRLFESEADIVFIEGSEGIGKTTLLSQFAKNNNVNSITHFINSADRYSYDVDFFRRNLYNQLYFYSTNLAKTCEAAEESIYSLRPVLDKAIKRNSKSLYIIIDGLLEIQDINRELLYNITADLPWGKVKFLVSGDYQKLSDIITSRNIKYKTLQMTYFSISESKEFLKDLTVDEEEINEIYKISLKGLPIKLEQVKRLCKKHGTKKFLSEDITDKTNLLEIEWAHVKDEEAHKIVLALLAFDDFKYSLDSLSERAKISKHELNEIINNYSFIAISEDSVAYVSEYFRAFAVKKLSRYKTKALDLAINYFIENPTEEESIVNLPHLYQKARKHKELISMLSVENFATLLQKFQSITTINQQFDFGLNASFELDKQSSSILKFALLKSSFKDIERYETFESEIDARISLNQPEEAYKLATNTYLKEDKLRLLTELAKQKKIKKLVIEPEIIDHIKELYNQIDYKNLGNRSIALASNLLYSCPELSIDLIEKISEDNSTSSFKDIAYTHLSVDAMRLREKSEDFSTEIELITSRIQNDEQKQRVSALAGLIGDYSSEQIIKQVNTFKETSQKLFFLERWIQDNKENNKVSEVIQKALEIVIVGSSEETPSATLLANIATPLPKMRNVESLSRLVSQFDSQKRIIISPTEDYFRLQIIVANAVATYNYELAKDRFTNIFFEISEIKDLYIKTNCLAFFWDDLSSAIFKDTIEREIKLVSTIFDELNKSILNLLKNTAYHDKMSEKFIEILIVSNFDFVISTIDNINTQDRRDKCYYRALRYYLYKEKTNSIDFDKIKTVYDLVYDKFNKDRLIVHITARFTDEERLDEDTIEKLMYYISASTKIANISSKCNAIVNSILILKDFNTRTSLKDSYVKLLYSSWSSIDIAWYKVELGFTIANDLSKEYPELANFYLHEAIEERDNTGLLDSTSLPNTYILSIKLAIRAFSGLINHAKDIDSEIQKLKNLISVLPSLGEQARLWHHVALNFFKRNKSDYFKKILREYIRPNLISLGESDRGYRDFVIKEIAPSLFLDHNETFYDFISEMGVDDKEESLFNTCYFILTKFPIDEPLDFDNKGYKLSYEEVKDVCSLMSKMDSDVNIYITLSNLIKCLKNHKLVRLQLEDTKKRLAELVSLLFPRSVHGIKHDGFKIASNALLLGLDQYNENRWNDIKQQAYDSIPNVSDKAFVISIIGEENAKTKKNQVDVLLESYKVAQSIPSNYDKFKRYNLILEFLGEISKTEFNKLIFEIARNVKHVHDEGMSEIHNDLIDLLYQHDPDNIDSYLSTIDNDIIKRNKLKRSIEKQIKNLKDRKEAINDLKKISNLKRKRELYLFSKKFLTQLNSGRITPKPNEELYYIVKASSELTLSEAYYMYAMYVENIVKRFEKSTSSKNIDYMHSIFESTVFNVNLIDILSQNNATKIRNRLKVVSTLSNNNELYFSNNERDKLDIFLRNWIENNVKNVLYIIDPYFTENDLSFLKIIKEVVPEVEVYVLTSKQNNNNSYENNEEVYKATWKSISDEVPPMTSIKVVWLEKSKKSPVHDRWWISDNAITGLRFGSSYGGVGLSKDSEISIMSTEEAISVASGPIKDYIESNNVKVYGNERVRYMSFNLDESD